MMACSMTFDCNRHKIAASVHALVLELAPHSHRCLASYMHHDLLTAMDRTMWLLRNLRIFDRVNRLPEVYYLNSVVVVVPVLLNGSHRVSCVKSCDWEQSQKRRTKWRRCIEWGQIIIVTIYSVQLNLTCRPTVWSGPVAAAAESYAKRCP